MKQIHLFLAILQFVTVTVLAQSPIPPPVANNFRKLTTYNELTSFIRQLEKHPGLVKVDVIGQSVKGRNLYAIRFSSSGFGQDQSKIKVLIFAQQHGNEQSGKEGVLLLAAELLKPENSYLFKKIDLMLIPQVNPDGSEVNQRRNANGMDLNRNHMILTEPETMALHQLFDKYLFEVTLDVHEYSPYGDSWKKYGYRKNADITLGTTTNINIPEKIREMSGKMCLPFIFKYLSDRKFSSFTYCPGGPPEVEYIRHSTFDVNDGRQSFGIQNTFSFIQEGKNGVDDSIENMQHRAEGQMTGMRGLLEFVQINKDEIKMLVSAKRKKLISSESLQNKSIQSVHVSSGKPLKLPLFSYATGSDTLVTVKDYRPLVRSLYDVQKPWGYLIPKDCTILVDWAKRQDFKQIQLESNPGIQLWQYRVNSIDS
ncbi:MAG: M14 family zinc carboxypeptidase, partial [Bacteroidetes bacterium]|nr:M14 family zinc carboxypeptidase [Bacteroidota bacterium]